jgi:hypothetical protein
VRRIGVLMLYPESDPQGQLRARRSGKGLRSSAGLSAAMLRSEGLKAGTAAIYAYGVIDFVDAFKKSRWVKYRYITGGNVGFRSDGKLIICEEGNETSED